MGNNMDETNAQCWDTLVAVFQSQRASEVLKFAEKRGIKNGVINSGNNQEFSAVEYAMKLYFNATIIGQASSDEDVEHYQILAIMIALETCKMDHWSYGTKLLYDMRGQGIKLSRDAEVIPFMAQKRDYVVNPLETEQFTKNPYAVAMHCSIRYTMYAMQPGHKMLPTNNMNADLANKFTNCWKDSPMTSVEAMLLTFVPAFLGEHNVPILHTFIQWLRQSGFYSTPDPENLNYEGGLAEHTCNLIARHVAIARPETEAEMGETIFTDVVSCVGKLKPELPLSDEEKAIYMVAGFFGAEMPEQVAAAVDCYKEDIDHHPNVFLQMQEYPLGIYLHMAYVITKYLDEALQ